MNMRNHTNKCQSAFTLIEIMVAAVITIIMIGLVVQITSEVLKIWNRSAGKLSATAEARIAMQIVTSDLESAVLVNNNMRWLLAQDENLPTIIPGYAEQTTKLVLFTPAFDRRNKDANDALIPGNIGGVEYELVYQDPVTGDPDPEDNIFALHRRLIDPVTTFKELLGRNNQEKFEWAGDPVPVDASVQLQSDEYAPPSTAEYYLAGNIVDFRIKFFVLSPDPDGDGQIPLKVDSPVIYGGRLDSDGNLLEEEERGTVGPHAEDPDFRYPIEYADISMTILSDEGMDILRNLLDGKGGTGYSDSEGERVILEHGEVFKRRVHFPAKPL